MTAEMFRDAETVRLVLADHNGVNSGARWDGSPDPTDWHNIRRLCKCGAVIGWHDRSGQQNGVAYPISGRPFDAPHLEHVSEVIASMANEPA